MTNPDVSAPSSARTAWPKVEPAGARKGSSWLGRLSPKRSLARGEAWFATFLVAPALIVILLIVFVPLVYSIWLSFAQVDLLKRTGPALEFLGIRLPLYRFVGLDNYTSTLSDPQYWNALGRTVYFVVFFVIETTLAGLAMALVLDVNFRGRGFMRAMLLVPWSLSRIAVGILWLGMLDADFGAINGVLNRAGLIDSYISFFSNGFTALNVLIVVYMWNQAPFATILFLAGLQSIPPDLYAAASVDGAGFWRKLWHVTLPSLRPMIFLVLVLATVNGFLMFDLIYVMTSGGPGNDTTTVTWLGYRTAFSFFKFGPGTAILFTLTLICIVLTFVYHRIVLKKFRAE
jgi:ABC-type sugar transport system permease subunit